MIPAWQAHANLSMISESTNNCEGQVLVIEVDGHAYHANNPKQLERDAMKDTVLGKCEIPILRVATTGSKEAEKLTERLAEILNR